MVRLCRPIAEVIVRSRRRERCGARPGCVRAARSLHGERLRDDRRGCSGMGNATVGIRGRSYRGFVDLERENPIFGRWPLGARKLASLEMGCVDDRAINADESGTVA